MGGGEGGLGGRKKKILLENAYLSIENSGGYTHTESQRQRQRRASAMEVCGDAWRGDPFPSITIGLHC